MRIVQRTYFGFRVKWRISWDAIFDAGNENTPSKTM